MKLLLSQLTAFVPALKRTSIETVADRLNALGFETEVLHGKTQVLDITTTPNRGYALSAFGIARELQAQLSLKSANPKAPLQLTERSAYDALTEFQDLKFRVEPALAPQYIGLVFDHVTIGPSPQWLQDELTLLGLRPINNIVDLTNYLMEIYGQPLHAFDLDAILGPEVVLRESKVGEKITTLDGTQHTLPAGVPVLQDASSLIDLAGIQGGANSATYEKTTRIFLQAAVFNSAKIYETTALLKHRTPAAYRYERGVDPLIGAPVLNEAIKLLQSKAFGSARAVAKVEAVVTQPTTRKIELNPTAINALLGTRFSAEKQLKALYVLGCETEEGRKVVLPSWRHDLTLWQDLAAEIIRLNTYDAVPSSRLAKSSQNPQSSDIERVEGLKDRLTELGFTEVLTYSFLSKTDLKHFELQVAGELENPLNPHYKYLRPSLKPNLARLVGQNSVFDPILIFEVGHIFSGKREEISVGLAIAGQNQSPEAWLARIADACGLDSKQLNDAAQVTQPSEQLLQAYKIRKRSVSLIEIPLSVFESARRIPSQYFTPVTFQRYRTDFRFPAAQRDIALIVDQVLAAETIAEYIRSLDTMVENVTLFDEFISERFGTGKKSVAFHILYSSHERTLDDATVDSLHAEITRGLETTFQATIR